MISQRSIDEVLEVAVIEDIVGEHVTLKRAGTSRTGLCPFHDDTSPSFSVSPSKKIYKCFSCGKAGNAATFLMENNQITFFDAIRELAKRYNIELDETQIDKEEHDANQKKRDSLFIALNFANSYYNQELLEGDEGQTIGQSYFKERGLLTQTIKEFSLGYSKKGWDHFYKYAKLKGYSEESLLDAGLIKKKEDGGFFDFFRERVIFPIKNSSGKIVAFAGRTLKKEEKGPKYLNSPETEVYHKSNVLYGIFEGKKRISKEDECYLVEGYLDVITLNQNGIEHVVASSGTALTSGQIRLISRFTKNITVLFDGDEAGLKAAKRGVDVILEGGLDVKIVSFPDGEDPDSYCRKIGAEDFKKYLKDNKKDFIFFMAEKFVEQAKGDPIELVKQTREILDSLVKIPDALKRSIYLQELAKIVNQDEKVLQLELNKILWKGDPRKQRRTERELEKVSKLDLSNASPVSISEAQELDILRILIQSGEKIYDKDLNLSVANFVLNEIKEDEVQFSNNFYKEVIEGIFEFCTEENSLTEKYFINNMNQKICALAANFLAEKYILSPLWEKNDIKLTEPKDNFRDDADSILLHFKRVKIHNHLLEKQEELKNPNLTEEEVTDLLKELSELKDIERSIAEIIGIVVLK